MRLNCAQTGNPKLQCIWEARAELGESTIWIDDEQALYFVDGPEGRLLRYSGSEGTSEVYRHDGVIGFIAQRVGGGFMAGMDNKLYKLDTLLGSAVEVACPEPQLPNSQFNDGKVDSRGCLWAGTLDRDCAQPVGSLYHVQKDLSWKAVDHGYLCPNGPTFSPDGRILYHTDSMRRIIYRFDLDLDGGAIVNKRVFVQFDEHAGLPDGMTVDCDGRLWVAHFGGARVTAFGPNGKIDAVLHVPVPNVTTCAFGGSNGTTLFITTSRVGMTAAQLLEAPLAGGLFACEGLARGIPAFAFDG
jgi:D-xylonolactonase